MKGVLVFAFIIGAYLAASAWGLLVFSYHIWRGQ
jgi:hypothetical protein